MKKRIVSFFLIACLALTGLTGFGDGKKAPDRDTGGAEAYRRAEVDPAAVYNDADKQYSNETVNPGQWTLAAKFTDLQDQKIEDRVHVSGIEGSYASGEACRMDITFLYTAQEDAGKTELYGSVYLAEMSPAENGPGEITGIRDYFRRQQGSVDAPVRMSRFGRNTDGLGGSSKNNDGSAEYYFYARGRFPKKVSEGEKLCLVFDVFDSQDRILMRKIWQYAWAQSEEDAGPAPDPFEDVDKENDPEFYSMTYAGHWDRTDVRYIGPQQETLKEDGIEIRGWRLGADGEDMACSFADGDKQLVIRVPEFRLEDRYYAEDPILLEVPIFCDRTDEDVKGGVDCFFGFAEVDPDEEGGEVSVTPAAYFQTGWPRKDVTSFGPIPYDGTMSWRDDIDRAYLTLNGSFPSGQENGEKCWLVYEVKDSLTGEVCMRNLYEYTWTEGPDTVWIYNPPMP